MGLFNRNESDKYIKEINKRLEKKEDIYEVMVDIVKKIDNDYKNKPEKERKVLKDVEEYIDTLRIQKEIQREKQEEQKLKERIEKADNKYVEQTHKTDKHLEEQEAIINKLENLPGSKRSNQIASEEAKMILEESSKKNAQKKEMMSQKEALYLSKKNFKEEDLYLILNKDFGMNLTNEEKEFFYKYNDIQNKYWWSDNCPLQDEEKLNMYERYSDNIVPKLTPGEKNLNFLFSKYCFEKDFDRYLEKDSDLQEMIDDYTSNKDGENTSNYSK